MGAAWKPSCPASPCLGNPVKVTDGRVIDRVRTLLGGKPGITVPEVVEGHVFHQYTSRVHGNRDRLQARLAEEGVQFELSVSLHAPSDALRTRLMPVNQRWPLVRLLEACRDYTEATNRIITFEYTLVRGVNDQPEHAQRLIELLRGWKCRVNLIPLSPVAEFAGEAPDERTCEAFCDALESARISTTLRRSRGGQTNAACGQLRLRRRGKVISQ